MWFYLIFVFADSLPPPYDLYTILKLLYNAKNRCEIPLTPSIQPRIKHRTIKHLFQIIPNKIRKAKLITPPHKIPIHTKIYRTNMAYELIRTTRVL